MPVVRSLEGLERLREMLQRRKAQEAAGQVHVIVGMGSCGIAMGAQETMQAILDEVKSESVPGVVIKQTGCLGPCEWEPIVEVIDGEGRKVMYGKVTPEAARRIVKEHVVGGKVIHEWALPAL